MCISITRSNFGIARLHCIFAESEHDTFSNVRAVMAIVRHIFKASQLIYQLFSNDSSLEHTIFFQQSDIPTCHLPKMVGYSFLSFSLDYECWQGIT